MQADQGGSLCLALYGSTAFRGRVGARVQPQTNPTPHLCMSGSLNCGSVLHGAPSPDVLEDSDVAFEAWGHVLFRGALAAEIKLLAEVS